MEAYRLNSRIVEDDKEFLVRTENDAERGIIRTSIYINGEFVDSNIVPHEGEFSEEQVLELVKNAHGEKKAELEFLLKNFREVLNNGSPDMMCQLGKAMYYKKMYAEAARLFGSAIKLKEDMHEAYFYLGQTELAAGNVEAAIRAAGEAVKIRPAFADYRNNLGEALLDNDNWRDAMEQFDEAIRKNVYYGDAYFNKALAHLANALKQEDPDIASEFQNKTGELLEKAALIDPYFKTSDFDEAVEAVWDGDISYAVLCLRQKRQDKREKSRMQKALHFQRYLLNTDWLSQGDIEGRISTLEREISKNPGYVDLYYELGVCRLYHARLSWKNAMDNFQRALEINPELRKAKAAAELSHEEFLKLTDVVYDITEKIK